jgi:hypothetical protein
MLKEKDALKISMERVNKQVPTQYPGNKYSPYSKIFIFIIMLVPKDVCKL